MYEEGNKKLNFSWLTLIIKLVFLALFVFLLCWLFTKTANTNNSSSLADNNNSEYITNMNNMKQAAFEYFTENRLPKDIGESNKLTLAQMINQQLLIDFTKDGKTCSVSDSYIQATKTSDGDYALRINLSCNEKSDFIVTTIESKECKVNCDNNSNNNNNNNITTNTNTDTNTNNSNNNNNNNISSNNSSNSDTSNKVDTNKTTTTTTTVKTTIKITIICGPTTCTSTDKTPTPTEPTTPTKVTYYQIVKYGSWEDGYNSGTGYESSCENSTTYNYCLENINHYYTTSYITENTNDCCSYDYTLKLKDIDANIVNKSNIEVVNNSKSYFTTLSDYESYLNIRNKNVEISGSSNHYTGYIPNAYTFKTSSLTSTNFTYKISDIYKVNNAYYIKVSIGIKNKYNITPYYATSLGKNIYFVPVKFDVSYKSCIKDSSSKLQDYLNKGYSISNYETEKTCKHRKVEYTWVSEKDIQNYINLGWYKTGKTEIREV